MYYLQDQGKLVLGITQPMFCANSAPLEEDETCLGCFVPIYIATPLIQWKIFFLNRRLGRAYTGIGTSTTGSAGLGRCIALYEENPHAAHPR